MNDESQLNLDYMLGQTRLFMELADRDDELTTAIGNAGGWARIAYDRAVAGGTPALTAALSIGGAINSYLMVKVMGLPDE